MTSITKSIDNIASAEGSTSYFPTYEDLREKQTRVASSYDFERLCWILTEPLEEAITVMYDDWYAPEDPAPEPYYLGPSAQDSGAGTWHSVAQAPLTVPKISSITIKVQQLADWYSTWYEFHIRCSDDYGSGGSDLSGDDDDDDDDSYVERELLECCGNAAPIGKNAELTVRASTEGGFVTVHDFVSAVHPWLLDLREDILLANGDLWDSKPLPSETKLMVWGWLAQSILNVNTEVEWLFYKRRDRLKVEERFVKV